VAGIVPFGTFDLYRASVPVYPISSFMLIHYLNHIARKSLYTFRSVMDVDDNEFAYLEYKLLVLPRSGVLTTIIISLILTVLYVASTPYLLSLMQTHLAIAVVECIIYFFAFSIMGIYFYHNLWQLRTVREIHNHIKHIDLFNRTPLYAFSNLSSRTGISLLVMSYFGIVTDPATFTNIALINVTIAASIIAVLCFLLPLQGIYRRIVAEKRRTLASVNQRFGTMMSQFEDITDDQHSTDIVEYHQMLANLSTTRNTIEQIPTLPWENSTLFGFISVFLIPFLARLAFSFLLTLFI